MMKKRLTAVTLLLLLIAGAAILLIGMSNENLLVYALGCVISLAVGSTVIFHARDSDERTFFFILWLVAVLFLAFVGGLKFA